jgi:hypothetical protein
MIAITAALAVSVLTVSAIGAGATNGRARDLSLEVSSWSMLAGGARPDTVTAVQAELALLAESAPDRAYLDETAGIAATRNRQDPGALEFARALFANAARSRPVSPYTWANFVHASYELGQTGEDFEAALRHAAELGPWEPEVQNTLVSYGLAVREEVTPQTRAAIDQVVANAMRRNPLETLQIAYRRGRLDIACRGVVNPGNDINKRYMQCEQ